MNCTDILINTYYIIALLVINIFVLIILKREIIKIIQDKVLHLLPSATLVDKIFENLSKNPYDGYNIDVDLSSLKFILNNKFKELFKMIGNIHE